MSEDTFFVSTNILLLQIKIISLFFIYETPLALNPGYAYYISDQNGYKIDGDAQNLYGVRPVLWVRFIKD